MPNYDSYLYANGALRLTRHGKGRGGNVLVFEHDDGKIDQCELADDKADILDRIENASGKLTEADARSVFDVIRSVHAIPGSSHIAA